MSEFFQLLTPITYWVLIALWAFILYFYIQKMWDSKTRRLFQVLIVILAIDAFRTLFESIYFGLWYTSLSGFIPRQIGVFLTRPELVIIPKILNVIAAVAIIVLLLRRWLPREELEQKKLDTALYESEEEFRAFFENNPVSSWLEDFSGVQRRFDELREQGVEDLASYLDAHPEEAENLARAIIIVDVNQATLDLHHAESKKQLLERLEKTFTPESFGAFKKEMVALWQGEIEGSLDGVVKTLGGEPRRVQMSFRVLPGYEKTLEKVSISMVDNTARWNAEQKLLESENTLKKYFDTNPSATFVWEAKESDFTLISVNNAAEILTNNKASSFIGLTASQIYKDLPIMPKRLAECLQHRSIIEFEHNYQSRSSGEYDWIRFRMAYAEPNLILLFADTITEKKKAEEALKKSQKQYQDLYDHAPEMFASVDPETAQVLRCNLTLANRLGYTREEILKRPVFELYHPDCLEEARQTFRQFKESGEIKSRELLLRHKNGDKIEVSLNVSPVFDDDGNLLYSRSSFRDISEQKQAEWALRESESRFKALYDNAPLPYQSLNEEGNIIEVNDTWLRILGYTRDEVVGRNFAEFLHPEWKNHFKTKFPQFKAVGEILGNEFLMRKKDGTEILVSFQGKIVKDSVGKFQQTYCVFHDISKQRQSDEEKRKLQEQLFHAQKLESIGTLAGGIAHDFNNILSSVMGFTELAIDDAEHGTEQRENLKEVIAAATRAKNLVHQILAFARQSDETIKPVKLDNIVSEVLKLIRSTIPTTIEMVQTLQSSSTIMASPIQIHQVLMNLCTNAAQAMQEKGGTLEVTLEDVTLESEIHSPENILSEGKYVELTIADTGHGIDPEIINLIYDPYFTTKAVGEGTGLGLAMVKGIIDNHGGRIEVFSEPGKNTEFVIHLPVTSAKEEVQPVHEPGSSIGFEHILFVDDEQPIAIMAGRILESMGYRVTTKNSSKEALALFQEKSAEFDLVITDMTMPQLTGDELAMAIRKIRQDIPIILCTGYSSKIDSKRAKDIGIDAFANKPFTKADLAATIREVLDRYQN